MERSLESLAGEVFDVIVVGGGIYGACVAWDAALRGLRVALLEKGDFASGTSANSLKIIHGGFRYLQDLDFRRLRESAAERRHLLQIAPHLVHPLCTVVPMPGGKLTHREPAVRLGLLINEALTRGRNRIKDPGKRIPPGRWVSGRELSELLPQQAINGVRGGVCFYDAQVYDSERLVISFIKSAADAGAVVANYVEATRILVRGGRVAGVEARVQGSGERLEVRAPRVVNSSGPWTNQAARLGVEEYPGLPLRWAMAFNAVVPPLFQDHAVGFWGRGGRSLFAAPWRGKSIVGTTYAPYYGSPSEFRFSLDDVQGLLGEFNRVWPELRLSTEDVSLVHAGLLPCEGVDPGTGQVRLAQHPRIHDHGGDGLRGLVSVVGVKYTTARRVAEETVSHVFRSLGHRPPMSRSASTKLRGGDIEQFDQFLHDETPGIQALMDEAEAHRWLLGYGTDYRRVMSYLPVAPEGGRERYSPSDLAWAETRHALHEEMAQTLADVVFRRTGLGTAGNPGAEVLNACAGAMAGDLGWDSERVRLEVQNVEERYSIAGGVKV